MKVLLFGAGVSGCGKGCYIAGVRYMAQKMRNRFSGQTATAVAISAGSEV